MMNWLRYRLLESVLWLQVPPFSWLYRAIYGLACRAVVRSLRRQPGLVGLYLTGSLASGQFRLGLSDIDFKVFVEGRRDAEKMQAINRRFLRLRRFFPMLGPPDEKGIFFLDDLAAECRAFPLVRLFFDPRFYRHRLLWGRDCMAGHGFAALDRATMRQILPWRLKHWNEKILLLFDAPAFAPPQQRYLLWKMLADMGRFLVLLDEQPEALLGREQALVLLAERMPPSLRPLLAACQAEHASGFRRDHLTVEQRFALWREVARFMMARLNSPAQAPELATVAHHRTLEPSMDAHWPALVQLAPADARCSLDDFFFVPASPLDLEGYGQFARIIHLERPLRASEYHRLKRAYRKDLLGSEPVFVIEPDGLGHCLWSAMTDHFFVMPSGEDGFVSFLVGDAVCPLNGTGMRRRLARLLEQIPRMLDGSQLPRLGRDRLVRFFFSSLQACYLAAEIDREVSGTRRLHLPGGPVALIGCLRERGLNPAASEYLANAAALLQGGNGAVAWHSLRDLLVQALEVAQGRRAWSKVVVRPEPPLAISLILVTRNRAPLLERCMTSLLAQTRMPDEWVVVDNGSTDNTPAVVQGFQSTQNIRYVFEARPGVGHARATGCAAATGDVLAFIDDDTIADPGWLAAIEQAFRLDPGIGIVGGRIDALEGGRSDFLSRAFVRYGEVQAC